MMSNDKLDGPGSETFILLNGLTVADDNVLGDYKAWVTNGQDGSEWLLTARSGGELLWVVGGVVRSDLDDSDTPRYTATVTEYAESDCSIDLYGEAHGRSPEEIVPFACLFLVYCPCRACRRICLQPPSKM